MTMTPEELETIGKSLYGNRWKTALARDLGRDPATIWRWVRGKGSKRGIAKAAALKIRKLASENKIHFP